MDINCKKLHFVDLVKDQMIEEFQKIHYKVVGYTIFYPFRKTIMHKNIAS